MKNKKEFNFFKFLLFVILVLYALSMITLIVWAFITSFKTNRDFLIEKNFFGLPKSWEFKNYSDVFNKLSVRVNRNGKPMSINVLGLITYTFMYAGVCCFLTALAPLLIAYGCTKFNYKFNRIMTSVALFAMALPVVGAQTSMVSVLHALNLYDTFFGMYCQKFTYGTMYLFVYIGIFGAVSKSYAEAAEIDGASELQIMLKIMFPLVTNVFFTVVIIHFIAYWNDYNTALLYLPSYPTLAYGIYNLVYVNTTPDLNVTPKKMAGCMILAIPIIILFIIFRNKLMSNLSTGGVKE